MKTRTKVTVGLLGIGVGTVVIIGAVVVVLESLSFLSGGPYSTWSNTHLIMYPNMHFYETGGNVEGLVVGTTWYDDRLAPLYVQFPHRAGKTYYLPDITEDQVRSMALSSKSLDFADGISRTRYVLAEAGVPGSTAVLESTITFSADRVVGCAVTERSGIRFSREREGEFIELPAKRRNVIKVFGKPLKVQRQMNAHT